jgi:hypothetical protein
MPLDPEEGVALVSHPVIVNRVIIQSGSPSVVGTWSLEQSDAYYHHLLSYLGSPKGLLGRRKELTLRAEVWLHCGDIVLTDIVDQANCPWIYEIMIGDDSHEGLGLMIPLKDVSASQYIARVRIGSWPESRLGWSKRAAGSEERTHSAGRGMASLW